MLQLPNQEFAAIQPTGALVAQVPSRGWWNPDEILPPSYGDVTHLKWAKAQTEPPLPALGCQEYYFSGAVIWAGQEPNPRHHVANPGSGLCFHSFLRPGSSTATTCLVLLANESSFCCQMKNYLLVGERQWVFCKTISLWNHRVRRIMLNVNQGEGQESTFCSSRVSRVMN